LGGLKNRRNVERPNFLVKLGNFIGDFSSAPSIRPEVLDLCKKMEEIYQISLQNRFELIVVGIYNVLKEKRKEL
jgi:hypothetical protein